MIAQDFMISADSELFPEFFYNLKSDCFMPICNEVVIFGKIKSVNRLKTVNYQNLHR